MQRFAVPLAVVVAAMAPVARPALAAAHDLYQRAFGVEAYIGVVPAEITKGHKATQPEGPMHGGVPRGSNRYHLVAALFDATSGERITNAAVSAQVSRIGVAGPKTTLDPMTIAGTITYGGYFELPDPSLYSIVLTIIRPGVSQPITLKFAYDNQ